MVGKRGGIGVSQVQWSLQSRSVLEAMLRILAGVFGCFLIISLATHSHAQIDDSAIHVCSPEESRTVAVLLQEYLGLVRGISELAKTCMVEKLNPGEKMGQAAWR